jgi:hypothetical protein
MVKEINKGRVFFILPAAFEDELYFLLFCLFLTFPNLLNLSNISFFTKKH